jgi:hypothetical protein
MVWNTAENKEDDIWGKVIGFENNQLVENQMW